MHITRAITGGVGAILGTILIVFLERHMWYAARLQDSFLHL